MTASSDLPFGFGLCGSVSHNPTSGPWFCEPVEQLHKHKKDHLIKHPQLHEPPEGLGQRCSYCIPKHGWSVTFTSFDLYANHVWRNHPRQTPYPILYPEEEINNYNYERKLKKRMKEQLPKPVTYAHRQIKKRTK